MGNDQDLCDAQPLKLEASTQPVQAGSKATIKESTTLPFDTMEFDVGALLKGLFPESLAGAIEQVLSRYPPSLFTTVPAHALPEALDTFLKTLTGYRESSDMPAVERGHLEAVPKQAVHKSIVCDCCGLFPIMGPRYKSTKKDDYDLCSKCFLEVGNAVDYIKLDRPKIYSRVPSSSVKPVKIIEKGFKRLDAQFVADVTILDATKIEMGSSFTKVWRLRNSGMLPWPQHTQLVHIGGNLLGSRGIVKLKLPEGGLPCGSELDVSVDLKAPKRSALHAGYWCLKAPSGQFFGDEVWVLIDAVPDTHACESLIDEATAEDADDFFLNTMVDSAEDLRKEDGAALEHACDSALNSMLQSERRHLAISRLAFEDDSEEIGSNSCLKEPLVNSPARLKEHLVDFPTLAGSHGETDCFSLATNELVKECVKDETFTSAEGFELVNSPPSGLVSEERGFDRYDANTEPLQRSCFEEDSSTSAGWDHMLNELEEMGFHNTQTNEDLLLKD